MRRPRVAFLFLGEMLLIPHLWPVVEALAAAEPALPIDLWVSTSVHERLLGAWSAGMANAHIRRAPGFRMVADDGGGRNPVLPSKLPMLMRLAPRLWNTRVAVCAELTSLWLPTLFPFMPMRFVKTEHGAGSVAHRTARRRAAARTMLVSSESERDEYLAVGVAPERVVATGYIKASFRQRTPRRALFPTDRPILLYTPHWQEHRSSWWAWGRQIVAMLTAQERFNIILAPHQRLAERDPAARAVLAEAATLPHVHADLDSFAMVDGSYTAMADLYLGDTSSQMVEFIARPRPCIFLNAQGSAWEGRADRAFWRCGDVVDRLDALGGALDAAADRHFGYIAAQEALALAALGDTGGGAPGRAVDVIRAALGR